MKRTWGAAGIALVLAVGLAWASSEVLSVQIKTGSLRASPSFLGSSLGSVQYGDRLTVHRRQGPWVEVVSADGEKGWIHQSALSKKQIVMTAGNQPVETSASGDEIALAGKGFSEEVEAAYQQENAELDYTWVDRMELFKVTPEQAEEFLAGGLVITLKGGR